jgi:two-component system, LytTR family, sensor kinase
MNIFASKEKYIGFDDRWMVVIGIPIVSVLVDALLFGSPIKTIANGVFWKCIPIALLFTSVLWISFREVMCFFVRKYPEDKVIRMRQILTVVTLIIGFFIIDFLMNVIVLQNCFTEKDGIPQPDISIKIIVSLIFSFLIYAIYEGIYLTKNIGRKMMEREELIKENVKSQLAGLRAQINPHFLFNSLNTLSSLVHEDAQRADQFVTKLSKVYRYMLDQNDEQLVLLSEEMKYLDAYKHLLKERFGDNLIFKDKTKFDALQKYIMPLSLQIIIENCVKHNIATKQKPLTIELMVDDNNEYITITNNLQVMNSYVESNGVGLENIKKRYACFTDKSIIIKNDGQVFEVSIPLLSEVSLKSNL